MREDQAKTIVFVTGAAIGAVTLLEYSNTFLQAGSKGQTVGSAGKKVAKGTESTFTKLFMLGIAMIILSFGADLAPEFVGPFTLLILVAFLYKKSPEIKAGYLNASKS